MFEKTDRKTGGLWRFILVVCLTALRSAPVAADEKQVGDSPQTVFKAAQEAGAKKDYGALAALVAPSERVMLAFGTDMAVGMIVEFYEGENADALKKKYQKIQKKYKIDTREASEEEKLKVTQDTPQEVIDAHIRKRAQKKFGHVDASKYVPELMAIVLNMPEMAGRPIFPQEALTELKIAGDSATGKADEKKLSFIREGGRWYLTADVVK